jgi:predicted secreted hydrolase
MKSSKIKPNFKIPYKEIYHGDFDAEWPLHDKVSGWWFLVGYLSDRENPKNIYSYQYTLLKPRVYGLTFYVLHMAFTDFQSGQHLFKQRVSIRKGRKLCINQDSVIFSPFASLKRDKKQLHLSMKADEFELKFDINKGKGAFWHGDNGLFVMGLPNDPQQRTVYYSYTNMPTTGEVILHNSHERDITLSVTGKSWFDRQWGPFRLLDPASHWEWFSLRFFDEEEIMLFAFPQHPYYDGTYIDKEGNSKRIRDYNYTPKEFIEINSFKFSKGWDLFLPRIKEERYEIRPIMDGQLNLAYFELMAEIINTKNERVGFCFVELLPGVRNPDKKISFWNLLKSI